VHTNGEKDIDSLLIFAIFQCVIDHIADQKEDNTHSKAVGSEDLLGVRLHC